MKLVNISLFLLSVFTHASKEEPIFIFVHGIFNSASQGKPYKRLLRSLGYHNFIDFNFKTAFYFPFLHRIHKPLGSSLGQESEIDHLNRIYEEIIYEHNLKKKPIPPIILIGVSLGAAIIINFLGTKQPKYISAVICESPFDDTQTILDSRFSGNNSFIGSRFYKIFKNHDPKGIQPIQSIKGIPYHIEILLLATEKDTSVPVIATQSLYQALLKNGHQNVSLTIFEKGKHARLFRPNKKEYNSIIKYFIKKILDKNALI